MTRTELQPNQAIENEQRFHPDGRLIILTGKSGSGKDFIADCILGHPELANAGVRRLVTCADRSPRPGEIHGLHYYFVDPDELNLMAQQSDLVETPLLYGGSRKATPRHEFTRVLYQGAKLLWRIDPSLAVKVASGKFYNSQFTPDEAAFLKQVTIVIYIDASPEMLERRRRCRDGDKYDPQEYLARDLADQEILAQHSHHLPHIIDNPDCKHGHTPQTVLDLISAHLKPKII